jgi:hypothetical protein
MLKKFTGCSCSFIWMCLEDYVKACDENVQTSGRVGTGSCTMTMPCPVLSILQCLAKNKMVVVSHHPSTHLTTLLAISFCTHRWSRFEREAFRWCCRGSMRLAGGPWQHFGWRLQTMFAAVGAALGWLHSVVGGVLWRELKFQTCTNILNKYFITILEIFGSPLLCSHYFSRLLAATSFQQFYSINIPDIQQ